MQPKQFDSQHPLVLHMQQQIHQLYNTHSQLQARIQEFDWRIPAPPPSLQQPSLPLAPSPPPPRMFPRPVETNDDDIEPYAIPKQRQRRILTKLRELLQKRNVDSEYKGLQDKASKIANKIKASYHAVIDAKLSWDTLPPGLQKLALISLQMNIDYSAEYRCCDNDDDDHNPSMTEYLLWEQFEAQQQNQEDDADDEFIAAEWSPTPSIKDFDTSMDLPAEDEFKPPISSVDYPPSEFDLPMFSSFYRPESDFVDMPLSPFVNDRKGKKPMHYYASKVFLDRK